MKPINEMNMEELAAYAVRLDGWEWRLVSGARTLQGRRMSVWAESAFLVNRDYENGWKKDQVVGVSAFGTYAGNYYVHEGIDLADPATLGCVLAMGRKRQGKACHTLPPGNGWRVTVPRPLSQTPNLPTEAHALIAALAKEVES